MKATGVSKKTQLRLKKESNPNVNAEVFFFFSFLVSQAYLVPEGFLTLPVHLVWGAQRDVLVLLPEHSFCQFIVVYC